MTTRNYVQWWHMAVRSTSEPDHKHTLSDLVIMYILFTTTEAATITTGQKQLFQIQKRSPW